MSTIRESILEQAKSHGGCSVCHGSINDEQACILCTILIEKRSANPAYRLSQNYALITVVCGKTCASSIAQAMDYEIIMRTLSDGHTEDAIKIYYDLPVNLFIQAAMIDEVYNRINAIINFFSGEKGPSAESVAQTFATFYKDLREFYDQEHPTQVFGFHIIPSQPDEKYIHGIGELVGMFAINKTATTTFERAIVEAFERPTCMRAAMAVHKVPPERWEIEKGEGAYGLISFPLIYERVDNKITIYASNFAFTHYVIARP